MKNTDFLNSSIYRLCVVLYVFLSIALIITTLLLGESFSGMIRGCYDFHSSYLLSQCLQTKGILSLFFSLTSIFLCFVFLYLLRGTFYYIVLGDLKFFNLRSVIRSKKFLIPFIITLILWIGILVFDLYYIKFTIFI